MMRTGRLGYVCGHAGMAGTIHTSAAATFRIELHVAGRRPFAAILFNNNTHLDGVAAHSLNAYEQPAVCGPIDASAF
jgi:hypothetical protein